MLPFLTSGLLHASLNCNKSLEEATATTSGLRSFSRRILSENHVSMLSSRWGGERDMSKIPKKGRCGNLNWNGPRLLTAQPTEGAPPQQQQPKEKRKVACAYIRNWSKAAEGQNRNVRRSTSSCDCWLSRRRHITHSQSKSDSAPT